MAANTLLQEPMQNWVSVVGANPCSLSMTPKASAQMTR